MGDLAKQKGTKDEDQFSSKVSYNMAINILRTVVMALFGFLMVPYYIDQFGLATYAILPLATSISSYVLAITDPLGDAFARYTSIAIQKNDMGLANRTYSSSMFGMMRCMAVLIPLVVLISLASPYVFNVAGSAALDVQIMFAMILLSSLLISFSACLGSVFMAYNKLYIIYASKTVYCVAQVVLVILFFVMHGASLPLLGASYVIASVLMILIMAVYVKKVCPQIELSRKNYDRSMLKEMSALGMWATLSDFGTLMYIEASLIIVNVCLGAAEQASFSIVANMISMINTATSSLAAVSVPLAYRYFANRDRKGLVDTMTFFMKFTGMVMAFPVAFIILFMPQILELWLGPGYENLYDMLYIMLPMEISFCTIRVLLTVPIVYVKMRPVAFATAAFGILNVAMCLVVLTFTDLGTLGVCACWAVSMFLLKVVFYPLYCSKLTKTKKLQYLTPLLYSHAMFAIVLVIGCLFNSVYVISTRWVSVIFAFVAAFIIYFIIVMRFLFNKEEKGMILHFLPGFIQRAIER